jgi:hypothetical protein
MGRPEGVVRFHCGDFFIKDNRMALLHTRCRRFVCYGINGVYIEDVAAGELPSTKNTITRAAIEFMNTLGAECQVSVVARGESSVEPLEPRVIEVYYASPR